MLVVTTRASQPFEWSDQSHITNIALTRLDRSATSRLARIAFRAERAVSADVVERIYEKSDGIPLFVVQLAGWLSSNRANLSSLSADPIFEVQDLQDLLEARLSALGDDKPIAQAASVIGRDFDRRTLVRLLAGLCDVASVDAALRAMLDLGLVEQRSDRDDPHYSFCHGLMRDKAYSSLLKRDRRRLHSRILDLFLAPEVRNPAFNDPVLAHHAEMAGRHDDAVDLLIRCGADASARSALNEAARLLEHARKLLKGLPSGRESDQRELNLIGTLGPVLTTLLGPGAKVVGKIYSRGVELADAGSAEDRARWFPIYWGWWFTAPEFATQRRRAEKILAEMQDSPDEELQLQALHCSWATNFNLGQHDACLEAIERGLALYSSRASAEHRVHYAGHDPRICALAEKALSLWLVGRLDESRHSIVQARQEAEALDHLGSRCHALDMEIMVSFFRRDAQLVMTLSKEMEALSRDRRVRSMGAKSLIFRGWSETILGSVDDGRKKILHGIERLDDIGTQEDFPVYFEMLSEAHVKAANFDEALETTGHAIHKAEMAGHLFWLAELHRRRAVVLFQSERYGVAEHLIDAVTLARRQGAVSLELRALETALELDPDTFSHRGWKDRLSALRTERTQPVG